MTNRKFSLAHLTLLETPPPDLIRIAARAGYDYVGLRLLGLDLPGEPRYALHEDRALFLETRAALDETGVQVLDIELARIIGDREPESYFPVLETAAALGARHVLSSVWMHGRDAVIDRFGRLCDVARPLGLTVNLEFVSSTDWNTLKGSLDVVSSCGRDNVGILIDTLHFHRGRIPLDELRQIPAGWSYFAHVADDRMDIPVTLEEQRRTMREERLFPGEGAADVAGILSELPPDVICAIELPHLERLRQVGPEMFARQCLEHTKRSLGASLILDPNS